LIRAAREEQAASLERKAQKEMVMLMKRKHAAALESLACAQREVNELRARVLCDADAFDARFCS
jgi:hypothetical protein